ncbi:WD domain-containing protein [Bimuria novae-zelandiae CBS 107.79]|uniref:Pre-rRNA-processing protein IPI3 n=1 Tax=Bimuria novae-zelandiae CBS 107.79 TaxID=1447943 RepID=A0A6A5UJH5_9PLEO|nr:WD domain-containing protein [Bimuria novae-zelandiae CBS 107.79]
MLTEHFVASISAQTKANTGVTKDAGIFFHEFQPLAAQRHVFKKSATAQNGLAVSSSHIFAAQAEKAVVHVYSREKGNQEAVVPFPERIHSIALAAKDSVLLLGTESGRVLAWEICSGRLVSTSTSHLQPVTSLAVDPTSSFFLSGSPDAMIHVWSLPAILSFSPDTSRSPVHTLSTHRGPISSIVCGNSSSSANIAISTSEDKSAIVWDYYNGQLLRTYLLPELPQAMTLDPADRACYLAYGDGSLQTVNFYDDLQKTTATDTLRDAASSHRPIQPPPKTRFSAESQKLGAAMALSLSWDGQTLISGHTTGKVAVWDTAKGNYLSTIANLPGPVTNLKFLEPTGFPNAREPTFRIQTVVRPKQESGISDGNALVPSNYTLSMQLNDLLRGPATSATEPGPGQTSFEEALVHPNFPRAMLDASLAELATWNVLSNGAIAPAADFLSLNEDAGADGMQGVSSNGTSELQELKNQLASLQRIQKVTFQQLSELREEKEYLLREERKRSQQKQHQAKSKSKSHLTNGSTSDVEMSDNGSSESDSDDAASDGSSEAAPSE